MSETSRHVVEKFDEVLDRLNSCWDLQLPRLYGSDAEAAARDVKPSAKQCSSRIRFLCYHRSVDVDSIVIEFEEAAKTIFTSWTFKPSQEKGTLPSFPITKSFLRRDMFSGKGRPVRRELQSQLIEKLSSVLEDEYRLAQDSESYQRVSSQEASKTCSRSTSFTTAISELEVSTSSKRRKISGQPQDGKRIKTHSDEQRKITESFSQQRSGLSKTKSSRAEVANRSTAESLYNGKKEQGNLGALQNVSSSFETTVSNSTSVFSSRSDRSATVSNNTSFESAIPGSSQRWVPTQSDGDFVNDEVLSLLDKVESFQSCSNSSFNVSSPFKRQEDLPPELHFWVRWEIYRIARAINLTPTELYRATKQEHGRVPVSHKQFWMSIRRLCKERDKVIPAKSDIRPWMEGSEPVNESDGKTASFTLKLNYNTDSEQDLWTLTLDPIQIDKGNLIHQAFGSDRHLVVFLNYFDPDSLPSKVKQQPKFDARLAFRKIGSFLAKKEHFIVGRKWRAFYIEPQKTQTKERRKLEGSRLKLHLFAVDGDDIRRRSAISRPTLILRQGAVTIREFLQWHIPFRRNLQSEDLKLFSRFGLALSKTLPTVVVKPHQFRYLPDEKTVMNEGCALMSLSFAKAIWRSICGTSTEEMPSAFQGRICGAKGLWMPDYRSGENNGDPDSFWIQVSDSQLKIKPHPRDRLDADDVQRTFQVLKYSTPCKPGHLNIQLINILADRKVSRAVLRQIVMDDIEEYFEASKAAMEDASELRAWLQKYHSILRSREPVSFEHGPPDARIEEICLLVEGGLTAKNCSHLRECIRNLMTQELNTYVDKLRIEIPHSTSVFCVPDPYKVLKADEVHIGFSTRRQNPKTGLLEWGLDDIDVLVARNPALLASDIQKRRAVYRHELRHFQDVIVFPTVGTEPLASLLSGGDYDGDTVTVIWEPSLTDSFENAVKPELPTEEDCGLQRRSRKMRDFTSPSPSEGEVDDFLESCLLFNAEPNRLGLCTTEHEKLIYSGARFSNNGPVLLAALAGYLVDASKQGLSQTHSEWCRILAQVRENIQCFNLAYKDEKEVPRRWNGACMNIIDYLKFDVAMRRKDTILKEMHDMLGEDALNYDRDLTKIYRAQQERCHDTNDPDHQQVALVLNNLESQLRLVYREWEKQISAQGETGGLQGPLFLAAVHRCRDMLQEIMPTESKCDIYRQFVFDRKAERDGVGTSKGSSWSLLRASALYRLYNRRFTWYIVGDELARIKARAEGPTRELTPKMHNLLKADLKLIKRLAIGRQDSESDEEFGD